MNTIQIQLLKGRHSLPGLQYC